MSVEFFNIHIISFTHARYFKDRYLEINLIKLYLYIFSLFQKLHINIYVCTYVCVCIKYSNM